MKRGALTLLALAALASPLRADTPAAPPAAPRDVAARTARVTELVVTSEFDAARKELAGLDPDLPSVALARALLALYEGDCDQAAAIAGRPELAARELGDEVASVARGCAQTIASTVVDEDHAHAVEVRYQDEHDRALTPLIVDTVVKQRDVLTRDLGATWPKPTRITVVRDLMSLSAMTGLSREAAMSTGTVAIAKWGRVTLLSPRASHHGYAWRDTIAHELTHLAISRATADHAPLWLQEGMAKREEVRWRAPGPFDDRPPPEAVVARGMEMHMDLPLDKLGPSIAMLPNADFAMVAFAEVTSFVRFLASSSPPDALPRLLVALRGKKSADGRQPGASPVDEALTEVTGSDLKGWDGKWRAFIAQTKREQVPRLDMLGLGAHPPNLRDARDRVRLAELLYGRAHFKEALDELDRLKAQSPEVLSDPSIRHLRARALEALGETKDAEPLVADAKEVSASFGPWWAVRGRFARVRGDAETADPSFVEAVAADPFDVESSCETLDPAAPPLADPAARLLCDAARQALEPPLGQD